MEKWRRGEAKFAEMQSAAASKFIRDPFAILGLLVIVNQMFSANYVSSIFFDFPNCFKISSITLMNCPVS
jgi:hypothetical protein